MSGSMWGIRGRGFSPYPQIQGLGAQPQPQLAQYWDRGYIAYIGYIAHIAYIQGPRALGPQGPGIGLNTPI